MKQKFQLKSMPMLIAIIMVLLSSELFAQENIDYSQLQDKEWVLQLPEGVEGCFVSKKFTPDTCLTIAKHSGIGIEFNSIYYLSKDWDGMFDDKKVGLGGTGKYLVDKRKAEPRKLVLVDVYLIMKLTKTDLVLKYVENIELTMKGKLIKREEMNSIMRYKNKQE